MLRLSPDFAAVAVITLSGMCAVMGYVTTRRTAEFGLRSALGAQPANIVGLVFGGAIRLAALGVVAGVLLSIAAARLLGAMLFGRKSTDPFTYAAVIAFVLPVILWQRRCPPGVPRVLTPCSPCAMNSQSLPRTHSHRSRNREP
jgi:putative ABC transport system permease protein